MDRGAMTDACGVTQSHGAAHFQRLYDASPDPWAFRSSAYEAEKYDRTLAALGDRRFRGGFEPGCSIGVLTCRLAERCDSLLAVDIVATPLAAARAACAGRTGVRFAVMDIATAWPAERFELIVLSEVLYFLSPPAIAAVARRTMGSLLPGGLAVLVNWLGHGDDPVSGDDAARLFIAAADLAPIAADRQPRYRIDTLTRR